MTSWQLSDKGLQLVIRGELVDLRAIVDVTRVRSLTPAHARRLLATAPASTLIVAAQASPEALSVLRAESRSYYVERTREVFLAPEITEAHAWTPPLSASDTARNPFAKRASRISRLLLLHPENAFTVQELSRRAKVDKSLASRTINALAADGYVRVTPSAEDERYKYVRLSSPRRLLEEWAAIRRRRRERARRFDIGTRTVADTLRAVADAAEPGLPYAISGLAGAQFVRRAVEPADVLLLTTSEGAERWGDRLLLGPTEASNGLLRMETVDDDFVFELAEQKQNLVVADQVQLWLDTASAGERSREASEAIADSMGW